MDGGSIFHVLANVPVSISWSELSNIIEPNDAAGVTNGPGVTVFKNYGTPIDGSYKNSHRSGGDQSSELGNTPNVQEQLRVFGWYNFFDFNVAPSGTYGFTVTISCLM